MEPERVLAHAERVRELHDVERKLRRLDAKVAAGHTNLSDHREAVAARLATLTAEGER